MSIMAFLLLSVFLVIEGVNRMGYRFQDDELVKGVLLALAGTILVIDYL
jgi:uncharacterized membrane protein HdeD (DUF308 family)